MRGYSLHSDKHQITRFTVLYELYRWVSDVSFTPSLHTSSHVIQYTKNKLLSQMKLTLKGYKNLFCKVLLYSFREFFDKVSYFFVWRQTKVKGFLKNMNSISAPEILKRRDAYNFFLTRATWNAVVNIEWKSSESKKLQIVIVLVRPFAISIKCPTQ